MNRTIMIMAGGTGGHIYPGLAVADALKAKGWNVVWLGAPNSMEAELVPKHGYPVAWVNFSGLRGKGPVRMLLLPLMLLRAFAQSIAVLLRHRPDVVLGMGGYITFPGGMMAVLLNRPLVVHEQNSIAGLSNKVLAKVADRVLSGFPDVLKGAQWCGNPVRADIAALPSPQERFAGRSGKLNVLVVGGSLGAQALNEALPKALAMLGESERPHVLHQTGKKHFDAVQKLYAQAGVSVRPRHGAAEPMGAGVAASHLLPQREGGSEAAGYPPAYSSRVQTAGCASNVSEVHIRAFLDDMTDQYATADVVICRAGALTIAELAAAGVASVLVPFPFAVDDHQTHNARFLSEHGAALLLPQNELSAERLAQLLRELNREKLLSMAQAARSLAKPDATQQVAQVCISIAG